ncbi:AraC family ligand binding domain-containing protein [Sorangium sp. So ce834]|uniref:AraC family transcriptional regulator n=1 Tax=Sorangium sp. So ce834 TaxID=3133321 RepID=UPI003F63397B
MNLLWQSFPMPKGRRAQAWRYHPVYRRPAHFHDEPEFNLVVRGTATFRVGHRRVPMGRGSLSWYPPGLDHYLEDASPDLELYVVGFRPELIDAFAREHGCAPSFSRPHQRLDQATLSACADAMAQVPSSRDDPAVEGRLLELLAVLAQMTPPPQMSLGHRAAALLVEAPSLRRDELTRRLASNRGDVSRKFRRDQGLSLTEYKNRLQTLKLLDLLEQGSSHLTHAALEAGFGSYSRCHQVIRELLGMAPSALLDPGTRKRLADRLEPLSAQHDRRDPG